jgi:hypothetical protein
MKHRSGAVNVICRQNLGLGVFYGFFFDFLVNTTKGDIISTTLRHGSHRVTTLSIRFDLGKAS